MKQLTFDIPEDLNEIDIRRFLAAKLYESGKFSLGQAADLTGLSKIIFSEILSDYDVSLINYPPSEIIRDAAQL